VEGWWDFIFQEFFRIFSYYYFLPNYWVLGSLFSFGLGKLKAFNLFHIRIFGPFTPLGLTGKVIHFYFLS